MTTATMVCSWSSFIGHGKVAGGGCGTSECDGGGHGCHCCQRKNSYPPSEGVCCQCSSLFVSGVVTSLMCIKKKLTFEKKTPNDLEGVSVIQLGVVGGSHGTSHGHGHDGAGYHRCLRKKDRYPSMGYVLSFVV